MNSMSDPPLELRVYIPAFNNSDAVCQSVASVGDSPVVIVDNGSEPEHRAALQTLAHRMPRCEVIFQPENCGRVANWEFCVRHFLGHTDEGQDAWMKWVFAGDTLVPMAASLLAKAAHGKPSARLLIADYETISLDGSCLRRSEIASTRLFLPADAVCYAARKGNWFGAPIGHCIHRDAVADRFNFGVFPWSADFHFCLDIASRLPVLYLAEVIGHFDMQHRRYHQEHSGTQQAVLQDALVRLEAARCYLEMTDDRDGFDCLIKQINDYAEAQTATRVANYALTNASICEIARRLRLREIVSLLVSETIHRVRLRKHQRKLA